MNEHLAGAYTMYPMSAGIRDVLLNTLSDADLAYELPGNPSLGMLLAEHAAVVRAYVNSYKTLKHEWVSTDASLSTSIDRLKAYFRDVDAELKGLLEGFSDEDVANKKIQRHSHGLPLFIPVQTLHEAVIIAVGKAVIYVRALGKPVPGDVLDWVG